MLLDLTISPFGEEKPSSTLLDSVVGGLTKDRLINKGKVRFLFTYVCRRSERNMTQEVRIWGLYTILIREGKVKNGYYGKTNDF